MALQGSLGNVLVNAFLPPQYRPGENIDKKNLSSNLLNLARANPELYSKVAPRLKKLGDEFATFETITAGLSDIEPEYEKRDAIVKETRKKLEPLKDKDERLKVYIDSQEKLVDLATKHPGDLALQVKSGGRGNAIQLQKTLATPLIVGDHKGEPIDYLIERSYSEGLSPAEAWIAGNESRSLVIAGAITTAIPGEVGKILAQNMSSQVISTTDCGTKNGVMLDVNDPSVLGRYMAGSNELISSSKRDQLKTRGGKVKVRSPITCEIDKGVCQKCMGTDHSDNSYEIGQNVGLRAATTMSEPLVQMQLSSKHGVSLVKGDSNKPKGTTAFKHFIESPEAFFMKAPVSTTLGKVETIEDAPQGGYDVHIGGVHHYVPPGRELKVSKGQEVEAGDVLSNGIPVPTEVVKYKGLGAGRNYLVSSLADVFKESGTSMDRRNIELLAKSQLNYVKLKDPVGSFLPGEIVPLFEYRNQIKDMGSAEKLKDAQGKVLTRGVLHHLPGTEVTRSMINEFKDHGIDEVEVSDKLPRAEAHMAAASRTPLLNPNWMQRLGWRYQKDTLSNAPTFGEKADLHGYDPYPSLVLGKEFRQGPKGEY